MARGSSGGTGGDRLAKFVAGDRLKAFVSDHLRGVTQNPIKFITTDGLLAYGYEATVLADICEAVLAARSEGLLQKQQEHIAAKCEILVRGFARVGIVALVDEATGFQYDRPRRPVRIRCVAQLDENLKVVTVDVYEIEPAQGDLFGALVGQSDDDDVSTDT